MSLRTLAGHEIAASEIVPGDGREDDPGEDSSGEDEDSSDHPQNLHLNRLGDEAEYDEADKLWEENFELKRVREFEYFKAHGSPEFWTWWTARNRLGESSPEHPTTMNLLREQLSLLIR